TSDVMFIPGATESHRYKAKFAAQKSLPLTGTAKLNSFRDTNTGAYRINFDFGVPYVFTKAVLENFHSSGADTDIGIKAFSLWGSNTRASFLDGTSASPGWDTLKSVMTNDATQHPATDTSSPEEFTWSNTTAYRYASILVASNHGDGSHSGFRDLEFWGKTPRYSFDYNFDSKITISDAKRVIWSSFLGKCIQSQGQIKPVWDAAEENDTDSPGTLRSKAVVHAFTDTNIVPGSFSWRRLSGANIIRVYYIDAADGFKRRSVEKRDDYDISVRGEIPLEDTAWYITERSVAIRRVARLYAKERYRERGCSLTGWPDSQTLEPYDRVTVTEAVKTGWVAKDFIILDKIEDEYGRPQFTMEEYLSGSYLDEGDQIQEGYSSELPNVDQPAPHVEDLVATTMLDTTSGYAYGSIKVSFTPPTYPQYSFTEVFVANSDSASTYYYVGQTSTGKDLVIPGMGMLWQPGQEIYIKTRHVNVNGVAEPFPVDPDFTVSAASAIKMAGWFLDANSIYSEAGTPPYIDIDSSIPRITVTDGTNNRVLIGKIDDTYFGIKGVDGSANTIFEISNQQDILAGWTITDQYILKYDANFKGIWLNSTAPYIALGEGVNGEGGSGNSWLWMGYQGAPWSQFGIWFYDLTPNVVFQVLDDGTASIAGWDFTTTTLSSGSFYIDSALPKISLGGDLTYMSATGIFLGLDDATYKMHIGNPAGNHLYWDGSVLYVTGQFISGAGSEIASTDSDTFTINADLDNVTAQLILGRTTGGNATLGWNGTTVALDKSLTLSTIAEGGADYSKFLVSNSGVVNYRTSAQVLADLSGDASAAFSWNSQNLTSVGNIGAGTNELTIGSINRATGTLTLEIGDVARQSITATATTFGGNLILPSGATVSTASGSYTLSPTGDVLIDPAGKDMNPVTGYDINLGSLQKKYLTLHAAELWVETLVAQNTIATIGGRILVGPTSKLAADLAATDHFDLAKEDGDKILLENGGAINLNYSVITIEHNSFAAGDIIYMEANGKIEFMRIISGATVAGDYYTYEVIRDLDGTGTNDWYAGDATFSTGDTGDGFIDIYSISGVTAGSTVGPTIVGNVRNSEVYNDWTEHWAIGNLEGLYGYAAATYGVAFGAYAESDYMTIDSTNGIRFLDRDNTVLGQLTSSEWTLGDSSNEHILIDSSGLTIKDGATQLANYGATVTIGQVGAGLSNVEITNGALNLRTDTTNIISISNTGVATIEVLAGGDIILKGHASNAGTLILDGTSMDVVYGSNATALISGFYPTTTGSGTFGIGYDFYASTEKRFDYIGLYADADIYLSVRDANADGGRITLNEIVASLTWFDNDVATARVQCTNTGAIGFYASTVYVGYFSSTALTLSDGVDVILNEAESIGIGPADERIEFYGAGYVSVMGANFGVGTTTMSTFMTKGLTINQGAADDIILALQSSDVAHGMTDYADTITYGTFQKFSAGNGALAMRGFGESQNAIVMEGMVTIADTTTSSAALGPITLNGYLRNGTGRTSLGNDDNLAVITDAGGARQIFKGDGDIYTDTDQTGGLAGTYDIEDDISLAMAAKYNMAGHYDHAWKKFTPRLQELGI
ncbi:MAG: hypothetical protein KKD77_22200, partial [Gammaproteobacteria bacterium]|nr:hypothetical protein [Gammaproteobacteria bacterium]